MKKLLVMMMLVLGVNVFSANFDRPLMFLFLGIDEAGVKHRSDAMILIKSTPFKRNQVLSIPRDSYVYIPCANKKDKLGHAYAYGGKNCTKQTIERLLDVKIDEVVDLTFGDARAIGDIIGPITIKSNVSFEQFGLVFEKDKEYQMKGREIMAYMRHRKRDNDFKRNERQRQVLKTIFLKTLNPGNIEKTTKLFDYMENVKGLNWKKYLTNLSAYNMLLNSSFEEYTLTGKGQMVDKIWYFELDQSSIQKVKKEFK